PNGEERLCEAAKHGLSRAIIPAGNRIRRKIPGMRIEPVEHLSDALELL
ncbi:MAG TPA: DNA repair protein RadA, partial [Thioalkalivibrio sp.]|nr:DNA repair protein RadA [Thioalkalivibrio sp.]